MKDLSKYADPFSHESDSNIGVVLFHGFTSTPSSVMEYGQGLAKAGFNVELPCLTGHGQTWKDLAASTRFDWLDDAEAALAKMRERASVIFAAGLSMGGLLALHLAQKEPKIAGTILINHAMTLQDDWRLALLPVMKYIIPYVTAVGGDICCPEAKERAYDRTPTKGVHELMQLIEMIEAGLSKVTQPTLIFKSPKDHVIPEKAVDITLAKIGSEDVRLIKLESSYHVATLDYDLKLITEESVKFIEEIAGQTG